MGFKRFVINKYEPWEDEKRLEELSAKGEFIKCYAEGFAYFKKGDPKRMKYSIEASAFGLHGKKRRFYEENGWKLACRGSDINILANEEPNAQPIHTDRSEYAHVIQQFHRIMLGLLIFLLVLMLLSCFSVVWLFPLLTHERVMCFADYSRYFLPHEMSVIISIIWLVDTGVITFYLSDLVSAGRFIAGNIESGKAAGKAISLNRVMGVIVAVISVLGAANILFLLRLETLSGEYPADISDVPEEAVMIDEFFPEGTFYPLRTEEDIEKYIVPSYIKKTAKVTEDEATRYTSAVTEEYFQYGQLGAYIPEGQTQGGYAVMWCDYLKFHTEFAAGLAVDDMINFQKEVFTNPNYSIITEFDSDGTKFDRVVSISSTGTSTVVFAVQKGRTVMKFNVHVSTDDLTAEEIFKNFPIFEKNS